VAEIQFTDADGVVVIVSLHLGDDGLPLEMDVWKTDFTPLLLVHFDSMTLPNRQSFA
jgi:hypothetical protein